MADLELRNFTKVYQSGSADPIIGVDDLSITLEEGNFLVLVGPSGCGKSTTLRSIAGLESVSEGEIRIDGTVVNDEKPKNRDIAMVFQNYALYPHMSARENMSFGLKMTTDLSDEEVSDRVERVSEMMGIDDLLGDKPKELSGGQQQRVALGRAIVREPHVFLLDEPLSNLDAKLRAHMRTEIQELQENLNITTVYVTHDQTEAMTMGDKIAILDGGTLQQVGTPLECYYTPQNQFVAGFIGEPAMNFFEMEVDDGDLVSDRVRYPLSGTRLDAVRGEGHVTLGIRPEDIELADGPGDHTIRANVNVVEPLGDINYMHADVEGIELTVKIPGERYVEQDTDVTLVLPEEKIHLFSGETGDTLCNRSLPTDESFPKQLSSHGD
ncbi:sn-glycerol-3-phosphate ABC transporter ATP-binding protein UgpC [Haladaptatus sp. DYF46]|uniref:ABC transporter ATP-binding protein n=1 Tax=Haladaptatus sp. DYF46 TaxID=2886041 RepID=UPI001E5EE9D7|nr:sn-glycerol-3-phosphate ABC transporter ATP-binding protein UgpC [Haladaptatus sp. DYF46]